MVDTKSAIKLLRTNEQGLYDNIKSFRKNVKQGASKLSIWLNFHDVIKDFKLILPLYHLVQKNVKENLDQAYHVFIRNNYSDLVYSYIYHK